MSDLAINWEEIIKIVEESFVELAILLKIELLEQEFEKLLEKQIGSNK